MKGCSTSLVIREMQIKSTMSYYLASVKMPTIKKSTNDKYRRGHGEKGNLLKDILLNVYLLNRHFAKQ